MNQTDKQLDDTETPEQRADRITAWVGFICLFGALFIIFWMVANS